MCEKILLIQFGSKIHPYSYGIYTKYALVSTCMRHIIYYGYDIFSLRFGFEFSTSVQDDIISH